MPNKSEEKCEHQWIEESTNCLRCGESRITTTSTDPEVIDEGIDIRKIIERELKEKILKSLPKEIDIDESGEFFKDNEARHYRNGFNQCLSEIKSLIKNL